MVARLRFAWQKNTYKDPQIDITIISHRHSGIPSFFGISGISRLNEKSVSSIIIAKGGYIYIMSNKHQTVFYIGVTADLNTRVWQHKKGEGSKFTKKYNCTTLMYYEFFDAIETAIALEKQLKKWKRAWKEALILKFNPDMRDLSDEIGELD